MHRATLMTQRKKIIRKTEKRNSARKLTNATKTTSDEEGEEKMPIDNQTRQGRGRRTKKTKHDRMHAKRRTTTKRRRDKHLKNQRTEQENCIDWSCNIPEESEEEQKDAPSHPGGNPERHAEQQHAMG